MKECGWQTEKQGMYCFHGMWAESTIKRHSEGERGEREVFLLLLCLVAGRVVRPSVRCVLEL